MKLVRDKIPELYPQHTYYRATSAEGRLLLRLKLAEEVGEILSAPTQPELLGELADLYTVLDALVVLEGLSQADVSAAQARKGAARGGFTEGWVLE